MTINVRGTDYEENLNNANLQAGIGSIENVGREIDKVNGMGATFAAFHRRWVGGDGCNVRLVAIGDPSGQNRIEPGQ